ncbi:membrane-associated, eicosanoid/glutathione metabolism protein [Lophiotrema nucula]|uniref:Membrane-associated, eicosanoid/glutathione metabolism protein n=1 Tax=Lophiotrema nucula TaxID=690887 RepID=A0A6A5ZTX0_9PLEO|nr:membrane-associated, eicosanoid/glutathione metabolism protein [Lophiotrema nucula]
MATKIGLGVPMPLLAPVSAAWAAPFAFYYLFLQNRVVFHRLSNKAYMGHSTDTSKTGNDVKDPLYVANRAQVNFIENVPIAFIIAILAELNGANRKYIGYGLGALFALRVSHVEFGMMTEGSLGTGRPVGYYGTQAVMAAAAGYLAYLVKDYWQI